MLDDDSPEGLVAALFEADLRDRARQAERILAAAEKHGAALASELASSLRLAKDLDEEAQHAMRHCAAELAFAADARETYEVLLRDIAERPLEDIPDDLEDVRTEHGEPGDLDLALALLAEGVREDDDGLRAVGSYLAAFSDPGTEGVLEALLAEFRHDPVRGGHDLCNHGDPAAAPALLEWLRGHADLDALTPHELGLASDIGVRLIDWGSALQAGDRALAHAAVERMCEQLEDQRADLEEQLQAYDDMIEALRSRLPGRLRPAGPRPSVGPNDPCPCGSGRKRKKCCG